MKFKMAAYSAMEKFSLLQGLAVRYQLNITCKYFEVYREHQNVNVCCQVVKQDVFKDMCERTVS